MSKKYSYAQEHCIRLSGKIMQQTGMLHSGARVGVALSGGVDSFVLVKTLRIRQAIVPFPFELMSLHLNPGFDLESHKELLNWHTNEGIALHLECTNYGPLAHSEENRRRSPCFRCAWLRRKRLFELCQQYHLTHLAMGHTIEDLTSTFFLNLVRNGRVEGMAMKESFFRGTLQLIRPLLLVEKKYIQQAAKKWQLPIVINRCPSAGKTARSEMLARIGQFSEGISGARHTIEHALGRWQFGLATGQSGAEDTQDL